MLLPHRTTLLTRTLVFTLIISLSGCGTLLHPERKGQISGRLDPSIVLLDAIGLVFFLVPGVVAFAVDFATGTIYLPQQQRSSLTPQQQQLILPHPGQLDTQALATVVEQNSGYAIAAQSHALHITYFQPNSAERSDLGL